LLLTANVEVAVNYVKVIAHALALTAVDRLGDILSLTLKSPIASRIGRISKPASPWLGQTLFVKRSIDGGVLGGVSRRAGAKYAIPKGLPAAGKKSLAIENEPHEADGFDGEITEGYGKGTKELLADETVVVKIDGKTFFSRMNYHRHNAERAGIHYDLVVRDVPPGTSKWELNIPRGRFKGRFAFVTTDKGMIVTLMKDQGVVLHKPDYNLKTLEWLKALTPEQRAGYVAERKYDGSLANTAINEHGASTRAAFRSHRDGGETYYDKLPALEFIRNQSPFFTLRKLDPGPSLAGTIVRGELVHADGVSRASGILNSHPEKAAQVQAKTGNMEFFAWDIVKHKGRDISQWPEMRRRELLEQVIREIRLYNKNWHIAEKRSGDPVEFYERIISDPRGLPYSEGIVLKPIGKSAGGKWLKVKNRDFEDLVIVSVSDSLPGTKYHGSVAVMVVEDPRTGGRGEVGSFAVSDAERQWIWDHREELIGAVAKVQVMAMTDSGKPRAGTFVGWHPDPRYGGIGSERALQMYSESLAGMDKEESQRMLYRLKSSAGWRRA
jgi:hypothetical protein